MATVSLSLDDIYNLAKKTLLANGCDEETSNILSDLIKKAERDGSLSHGLFRLPAYISGLKSGKINGKSSPVVSKITPSVIKVDGKNCLAPMVLEKGIPELIKVLNVSDIWATSDFKIRSPNNGVFKIKLSKNLLPWGLA